MVNRGDAISKPERLVIIYDDGYMEIAKYNPEKEIFKHFENLNEHELNVIRKLILKKEDRMFHKMPKSIDMYMDHNNFSFIVKSHKRKLPFSQYNKEESVSYVETTLPDLYFKIENDLIKPYVYHRGNFYYNPLPNITEDNLCMGNSDKSYKKELSLEKKIEAIKYTFFNSTFSHSIDFDKLQSWFDGKPNIKLLNKVKNKIW